MLDTREMRYFYLGILFVLLSCSSQKQLNTIERLSAKVSEFEQYNLFETDHFTVRLPKNWKTYLEPSVKEQVRHSPLIQKGKIDQNQYLWLAFFASDHPEESIEKMRQIDHTSFFKPKYSRQKHSITKGEDGVGNFIRTQFELLPESKGEAFTIRHYYYPLKEGYLLIRMYFKTKGNLSNQMEKAKETILLKD